MEDFSENSDEDTLEIATKTWDRVIKSAEKVGFREGIQDGSMSIFQDSFDKGYKEAFKPAFMLGVYKGLANCVAKDVKHPIEIENLLSNSKKGICYICKTKSKESADTSQQSMAEIESCQHNHQDEILKTLQNYFDPILKKSNIDLDFSNFYE